VGCRHRPWGIGLPLKSKLPRPVVVLAVSGVAALSLVPGQELKRPKLQFFDSRYFMSEHRYRCNIHGEEYAFGEEAFCPS
jgi:hypothetical protein